MASYFLTIINHYIINHCNANYFNNTYLRVSRNKRSNLKNLIIDIKLLLLLLHALLEASYIVQIVNQFYT